MNEYKIKYSENFNNLLDNDNWKTANTLYVDHWPWHKENYTTPKVEVKLLYSNEYMYVRFKVKENTTQAVHKNFQDMVCEDSCVEFFVSCDNKKYFNFEINVIGTMLLRLCRDRNSFVPVSQEDILGIEIQTSLPKGRTIPSPGIQLKNGYIVAYKIPFKFFTEQDNIVSPISGSYWKANFYKCGDLTPEPCWGSWSYIKTENPDFHRPEYFGKIYFE